MCARAGCPKAAGTMSCPTCLKLGMPPCRFCSQRCFKAAWKEHKKLHTLVERAAAVAATLLEPGPEPGPGPESEIQEGDTFSYTFERAGCAPPPAPVVVRASQELLPLPPLPPARLHLHRQTTGRPPSHNDPAPWGAQVTQDLAAVSSASSTGERAWCWRLWDGAKVPPPPTPTGQPPLIHTCLR
jgi:hypothetical protein